MNTLDGQADGGIPSAAPSQHVPPPLPPPLRPPSPYPPTRPATPIRRGYIAAHWHGDLSLALSYWVNLVLVTIVVRILFVGLSGFDWQRHPLTWAFACTAICVLVSLLIAAWQYVGVWRAAERSGSGWGVVARILVVIGCLGSCFATLNNARVLTDMAHAVAIQRTWDDFHVGVSPDGRAIAATGTMGVGFTDQIEQAFADHAGIHMLRITSRGGSVNEGAALYEFLHTHPDITIEADGLCASSCTRAFIGAARRWATPRSWFGFHQMRSLLANAFSTDYVTKQQDDFKQELRELGASPDFIRLAFAKQGGDVFVPDSDELFKNHIIDAVDADGQRWQADAWQSEQFLDALRRDPQSRGLAQAFDRIAVVQPTIYQQWLQNDLAVPRHPLDAAAKQRNANFWHALDNARRHQLERASTQDVRGYAVSERQALAMLRQRLSPSACGRYASGVAISLGNQASAFKGTLAPGYLALFSGNDIVQLPPQAWRTSLIDALRKHQAEHWSSQGEPADDAHWSAMCTQQMATLDQLLDAPGAAGDLALRAYLRVR